MSGESGIFSLNELCITGTCTIHGTGPLLVMIKLSPSGRLLTQRKSDDQLIFLGPSKTWRSFISVL